MGIAPTVGHALTYKVYTDDTHEVIYRSGVWSALDEDQRNLRIDPLGGEETSDPVEIVRLSSMPEPTSQSGLNPKVSKTFSPEEIVGKSYMMPPNKDGERLSKSY